MGLAKTEMTQCVPVVATLYCSPRAEGTEDVLIRPNSRGLGSNPLPIGVIFLLVKRMTTQVSVSDGN